MTRLVQNLRHPHHGGEPTLEIGERPSERDGRPREVGEIPAERHEGAEGDAPVEDGAASHPEHDQAAHSRDETEHGRERGLGPGKAKAARQILAIQPLEGPDLTRFHGVGAHHGHAAEILLHLGGQRAQLLLERRRLDLHAMIEAPGEDDEQG